jgi:hypothetical protein
MENKSPKEGRLKDAPAVLLNPLRKIKLTLGPDVLVLAWNGEKKSIPYSTITGLKAGPETHSDVEKVDPILARMAGTLKIKTKLKEYQIAVQRACGWRNEIHKKIARFQSSSMAPAEPRST